MNFDGCFLGGKLSVESFSHHPSFKDFDLKFCPYMALIQTTDFTQLKVVPYRDKILN